MPLLAQSAIDLAPLKKWIARQDEFQSVSADFVQTRALRALKSPLKSKGRLWFSAPSAFRWELGNPPKTMVLRRGQDVFLITPGKRRAEHFDLADAGRSSGMQALAMVSFPLARNFDDFTRKFEVLALRVEGALCHLEILPRDPQARKFLSALKIDFEVGSGEMHVLEIVARDGSTLRSEFTNVRVNAKIDPQVFDFDLSGFKVVDGPK